MKKLMFAAFIVAGTAGLAAAQVNFDRGVDVKKFISEAKASETAVPAVKGLGHNTRDCARFSFSDGAEQTSPRVWLRSQEYVQECTTIMQPGPNGQMVPVQNCHERPGMSWSQTAQIKIGARALLPWETETFDVCLDGPFMDIYANEAAYKYSVARDGGYDVLYTLTPGAKTPMKADENGINFGAFSYAGGKYTFSAADRWAKEYAGEKTEITVELYKDNVLFFDGFKGSKTFSFDAAETYTMTFSEDDLAKAAAEEPAADRGSKKYFLKWGFKRVGAISKDNYVKKGKTPVLDLNAAPARGAAAGDCLLAMDTDYTCIYRCADGSYISKPAPFFGHQMPGFEIPMHGCRMSVPNEPLITIQR